VNAKVILYADTITPAMRQAIDETRRRREMQLAFNAEHGITPQTVRKAIRASLETEVKARKTVQEAIKANESQLDQSEIIKLLEEEMLQSAQNLEFERAAELRDKINQIKGAPMIRSGGQAFETEESGSRIWQPRSKGRGRANRAAK
jgi:excinuclease ABC subunit B